MAADYSTSEEHTMLFGVKEGSKDFTDMWFFFLTRCHHFPRWYISEYGLTFEACLTAKKVRTFIRNYGDDLVMICDTDHCADSRISDFGYIPGDE